MEVVRPVFEAFIDINIVLALALALWFGLKVLLDKSPLRHAYGLKLRLLNGIAFAVVLTPLAVLIYLKAKLLFGLARDPLNLSDLLVASYLKGDIAMKASAFESLLAWRGQATEHFLLRDTPIWLGLFSLLMLGALYYVVRLGLQILRLRATLSRCHEWRQFGSVSLLISDHLAVPFSTRGLRRRYVVLPAGLLTRPADLRLVLRHELQHLRQRDVEWEVLLECARPLFFWNPAFKLLKREVEVLRELACDQQVVTRKGTDLRAYCDCLLRACRRGFSQQAQPMELPVVTLVEVRRTWFGAGSSQRLRDRMLTMFEHRSYDRRLGHLRHLSLLFGAALLVVAIGIQKPADWSHDRIMLDAIVNLEKLNALNTFGRP
ncbi:M56 family metallopeptidase [Pseudoruegeria sp. SHC-113]|uniref:M56 family metallopeptidase n=1 Tax=Pseudoruegeria sp. SHC-113 TaxID=2855439 RepID=UPI0021BA450C|nr:M56 family metallopeptidase [Pseudoruegeria sp. SHC-113]MCT8158755.1 M56 family metallopeptidase [Pseudoruegeria sp. SHC-113]